MIHMHKDTPLYVSVGGNAAILAGVFLRSGWICITGVVLILLAVGLYCLTGDNG